ncbi:MAG: protein kinase domain-containing protein [Rhodanobacteraceae bacterium]
MTTSSNAIRDLFEEALGLPPAEREAFLHARCTDPTLRGRLERMLEADADGDIVLERGAHVVARAIGDPDVAQILPPGSYIGPFQLLDVLGEGGSSTVFRAVRVVDGVRQVVALKLLRRGLYSPDAQRQFRRERLALSQLRHPGIARLIEGGVTESGLAYIALDLVDGVPITEFARSRQLNLRQRLQLFVQVCRAVEAAHRALIVHRDLKPSNVLVNAEGEVKLLDFGIAKLLDAEEDTQTRMPAFTPAYAAPEQRDGGLITTATDVYALGVLLGEMVTGQRLNDGTGRTPSGQITGDTAPGVLPAPPAITRRQLRGDLDNIVLKSIAPESARRYASAGALAEDIERSLEGRPVNAHPPSTWYRARKFVTRHKGGVAITAMFVLGILAALGIAVWQAGIARAQASRANAMRDFMFAAFEEAEPSTPREGPPSITAVVEQAIAKVRGDTGMNAAARTELLTQLGGVLRAQGRLAPAEENLQSNYDQALAAFGPSAALTLDAGRELVNVRILNGEFAPARTLADGLLAATPASEKVLRAQLLGESATLSSKVHEPGRAARDAHASVELARTLNNPRLLRAALETLANVQLSVDDVPGAIASYEELLAQYRQAYGAQHVVVAEAETALSRAYRRSGDFARAEQHIRDALAIDAAVLSKDDWRHALHLNALVMLLYQQRDYAGALAAAEESLRINRIAYGDAHPEIANDFNSVGMLRAQVEDFAGAVEPLREALARSTAAFGAEHYETAVTRSNYGVVLARSGNRAEGEAELKHALAALEATAEPDLDEEAATLEKMLRLALDAGDARASLALMDRIDALLAKIAPPKAYWDGRAAALRGLALLEAGQIAEARARFDGAAADLAQSKNPDRALTVEVLLLQASAAADAGDIANAQRLAPAALEAFAALRNPPGRLSKLAERLRAGTPAAH